MQERTPSHSVVRWYLIALGVATLVVYLSSLKYFLAQDDFVLLERAAFHPLDAVTHFFSRGPGQFRPLTKGLYFVLSYRLFGLHAVGYHAVSLAVHAVNALLAFALLRRMRVGIGGALTGATLFALASANFTAVVWATCIQQLLAMSFMLATMIFTVDATASGRAGRQWLAVAAYAGALLSLEQAALLPVVTTLLVALGLGTRDTRVTPWRAVVVLRWQWLLMALYAVFMLGWKTLPGAGVYHPTFGTHVFLNAWTLLARTLHYFVVLPSFENAPKPTLYRVLVALPIVVVYHLSRRRWREVVFALAFFVATTLPVLGLTKHAFYYQTYVAGFGTLLLISLAVDDVYATMRRAGAVRVALLAITLVACTALSRHYLHRNETELFGTSRYLRSFVVRRAQMARNVYGGVMEERSADPSRVIMVYARLQHPEMAKWNIANVREALGGESALRLFYDRPLLEVRYVIVSDSVVTTELEGADLFRYTDFGEVIRLSVPAPHPGESPPPNP